MNKLRDQGCEIKVKSDDTCACTVRQTVPHIKVHTNYQLAQCYDHSAPFNLLELKERLEKLRVTVNKTTELSHSF